MVQRVSRTPKPRPRFIEPMECRSVAKLPEGEQWVYEVKQDGYRAEAIIDGSTVTLYSIAGHGFNEKFPQIVESLSTFTGQRSLPQAEARQQVATKTMACMNREVTSLVI
jgi:bifunctional non-homologous end joining protein LigD